MENIESALTQTYEDFRLSKSEKTALREVLTEYRNDIEILSFARNRAFDLVQNHTRSSKEFYIESLKWLEHVIKTIDSLRENKTEVEQSAYFSPGKQCVNKIISLINATRKNIDVCVFTISDNRISEALVNAHNNNKKIRIISDNDKSSDMGSDIDYFIKQGLPVKTDTTPNHMHHKFAIFDKSILVNGSFNWTRSASKYNHENITVTTDNKLVVQYLNVYEELWDKFIFYN